MLLKATILAITLAIVGAAEVAHAESPDDILVIANKSVPQSKITAAELKLIFLKKKAVWAAGKNAVPVNAPAGSKLREEFRSRVLSMSASQAQRYWVEFKIRKGGSEPPTFSNMLKAIFKLKGSVGYIYRSQYREGVVKVLMVLPTK